MALPEASSIDELLAEAVKMNASDLHVECGTAPKYRKYGTLRSMNYADLTNATVTRLLEPLMDALARKNYQSDGQIDMSYQLAGSARFRVNIFRQKGAMSAVFRVLSDTVPDFNTLGLPMTVFNLSRKRRGLVLVTGPTGSGKTTTLASVIDIINKNYYKHIVTLEDPIEYLHWHARCNISQREVGSDVNSFGDGLRASLRQDPDIILIGEMRDMETMQTALVASETGHLVLSTLHTIGAAETVNRIVDTFPEKMHAQIRNQLSCVLDTVVSQQLLPRCDKEGFICAYEILVVNKEIQGLILNNDIESIADYMTTEEAKEEGMCTMDDTIISLFRKGNISRDVAIDYAVDRKYVELNCRKR